MLIPAFNFLWNKRNKYDLQLGNTEKFLLKLQSCLFSGQINFHWKNSINNQLWFYIVEHSEVSLDSKFIWLLFYEYDESVWLAQTADYSFSLFTCYQYYARGERRQILLMFPCTYRAFLSFFFFVDSKWARIRIVVYLLGFPTNLGGHSISFIL